MIHTLDLKPAFRWHAHPFAHAQVTYINGLKAVPRAGYESCLAYGKAFTNGCATTKLMSFFVDAPTKGKQVSALVYSDAAQFQLVCRAASTSGTVNPASNGASPFKDNLYAITSAQTNTTPSALALPLWSPPYLMYEIDCWVPPQVELFGAAVIAF